MFDDIIRSLINNSNYVIKRPENIDELESSNIKIFFSSPKIKFIHTVTIYDNNNNIIGFVLAEMAQDYSDDLIDEQQIVIKDLINKITPVLLFSEYNNDNR